MRSEGSHLVVGVVAAAAELVPALGAAEVHAAAFGQIVLEPAVGASCGKKTTHPAQFPCSARTVERNAGLCLQGDMSWRE